jgi:hypothetical protein
MENKTGLQSVAATPGGLMSISGIMAYLFSPLLNTSKAAIDIGAFVYDLMSFPVSIKVVDNFVKNLTRYLLPKILS